jgi:hypothetical protein
MFDQARKTKTTISVRGRQLQVPSHSIDGVSVIVTGRVLRTAALHDEVWQEHGSMEDLLEFVKKIQRARLSADLFTFGQQLPTTHVVHAFPYQMSNLAVASCSDFERWWSALPQETRKHVRKARKLGLVVREVQFDHELVHGLKAIYDESPMRQGRRFWHYGKDMQTVAMENSTYLDRSILLGAYYGHELVGFIKVVRVGATAHVMQLVAKLAHREKKPNNALLAKAIEVCAAAGITSLVYGQYVYGKDLGAPLTEFKRRNGFQMVLLPQYFVPLNWRGRIAILLGLHFGWRRFVPSWLEQPLRALRSQLFELRYRTARGRP